MGFIAIIIEKQRCNPWIRNPLLFPNLLLFTEQDKQEQPGYEKEELNISTKDQNQIPSR